MRTIVDLAKSFIHISGKQFQHRRRRATPSIGSAQWEAAFTALRSVGVAVIPDFLTPETCADLRDSIDGTIAKDLPKIWRDKMGSDSRIFGFDRLEEKARAFFENPLIQEVKAAFYAAKANQLTGFVMANRVQEIPGNLGSGGGWHRDSVHETQMKAIVYLSDVAPENGPFEYLQGTHRKSSIYNTIKDIGIGFAQNRFTEAEIERIIAHYGASYPAKLLTGKAGTLILTDTSGIHRGSPLRQGSRYALTQYIFRKPSIGGKGIPAKIENMLVA